MPDRVMTAVQKGDAKTNDLVTAQQELAQRLAEVKAIEAQIEEMKRLDADIAKVKSDLDREIQDTIDKKRNFAAKLMESRSQYDSDRQELTRKQQELMRVKQELNEVTEEVNASQRQLEGLQVEKQQTEKAIEKVEKEIFIVTDKIKQLQDQMPGLRENISNLWNTRKEKTSELEREKVTLESMKAEISKLKTEKEKMDKQPVTSSQKTTKMISPAVNMDDPFAAFMAKDVPSSSKSDNTQTSTTSNKKIAVTDAFGGDDIWGSPAPLETSTPDSGKGFSEKSVLSDRPMVDDPFSFDFKSTSSVKKPASIRSFTEGFNTEVKPKGRPPSVMSLPAKPSVDDLKTTFPNVLTSTTAGGKPGTNKGPLSSISDDHELQSATSILSNMNSFSSMSTGGASNATPTSTIQGTNLSKNQPKSVDSDQSKKDNDAFTGFDAFPAFDANFDTTKPSSSNSMTTQQKPKTGISSNTPEPTTTTTTTNATSIKQVKPKPSTSFDADFGKAFEANFPPIDSITSSTAFVPVADNRARRNSDAISISSSMSKINISQNIDIDAEFKNAFKDKKPTSISGASSSSSTATANSSTMNSLNPSKMDQINPKIGDEDFEFDSSFNSFPSSSTAFSSFSTPSSSTSNSSSNPSKSKGAPTKMSSMDADFAKAFPPVDLSSTFGTPFPPIASTKVDFDAAFGGPSGSTTSSTVTTNGAGGYSHIPHPNTTFSFDDAFGEVSTTTPSPTTKSTPANMNHTHTNIPNNINNNALDMNQHPPDVPPRPSGQINGDGKNDVTIPDKDDTPEVAELMNMGFTKAQSIAALEEYVLANLLFFFFFFESFVGILCWIYLFF